MPFTPKPSALAFWFLVLVGLVVIVARAATMSATAPWFSTQVSVYVYSVTLLTATVSILLGTAFVSARASRLDEIRRAVDFRVHALRLVRRPDSMQAVVAGDAAMGQAMRDSITSPDPGSVARDLVRQSQALGRAHVRLWRAVAGPIAMAVGFAAAAGMMLPGSGGFAEAYHSLNSTLILTLTFGWVLVLIWLLVAIATMPGLPGLLREARNEALV